VEITVNGTDHSSIITSSQFQDRVLQAVQAALDGTLKGPGELALDSSFMFIVNGQRHQVEDDGSYVIQNISAPDEFGPGGPGSDPDFVADDQTQIVGIGKQGGEPVYLLSEAFRVLQNGTLIIEDLEVLDNPPPLPERLTLDAPSVVLSPGETTQFSLVGLFFDGSMRDLTPTSTGTTYRVTSLDVIDVDDNGQVNAVDNGIAFLTATNFGVTSVKRLTIASQTLSTTVEGFVVDESGDPLEGAEVTTTAFGGTATSDAGGFFSFDLQLPGTTGFVTVVVTAGELEFSSDLLPVMVNGITDAGILGPGPQSFTTTVRGVVQFEGGGPAENAAVFTNFGGQGLTGSDGSFSFEVSAELGKGLPTLTVTARLAANGMNFAGNAMDIPIVNGGVTDAGTITLRTISLSPYPGQRFQIADNVERFVTVDIDGDEHLDIASVGLNGEIRIDFGMGDGTFRDEPVLLSNEGFLRDIAVGNLNEDTISDLAVVDYGDNELLIFLGNSDGSYQEPLISTVGESPGSIVIGNLDGDDFPDLAIGSVNTSEIVLLSGNGDGTFDPLDTLDLGGFFNLIRIVIQDINDDTNPDIIASHQAIRT
jgi:hypothetical protein